MIGLEYVVTPVDGEPYTFTTTLVEEMAWERYARQHKLPILPDQNDLSAFTMMSNGAVLAWAHAKRHRGELRTLDDYAACLISVLPGGGEEPDAGVPAPFPDGDVEQAGGGDRGSDEDPS